ncbi:MAG: Omp28-related outer membrane protein [Bacteroidota bacterium]
MKKITLICSLFVSSLMNAQTFIDNFDSYTAGQKLAQQSAGAWTTWSNTPGSAEDGLVSNANAFSLPNSMYFSSTASTGGPVDQVKHFGVLNTGSFSLEWNMFVETGKAAYFNLQKTATMGQIYALDVNFNDNGALDFNTGSALNLSTTFTQNTWFNFRLDINFNTNTWEVFIDDVSKGTFANSINQIEAIDLFPVDQNSPYSSGFFVDDFQYTITPYVLPNLNLAANLVSFTGANLSGSNVTRIVKVRNLGLTAINSFDITCNYNGIDEVQNVTGLNLASLAETTITITAPLNLIPGSNVLTATVSNVNTGVDEDANDNVTMTTINPTVRALGKVVVGEEGTGTWCQWCPRGAVFMEMMENTYGEYWAGIAVHNGANDPMKNVVYDAGMGALISGYPSSLVDRGDEDDPSAMEPKFLANIQVLPAAVMKNEATWNSTTRELAVTVKAKFISSVTGDYKLACVITEDDVTGTTSGYAQVNAYAGGGSGVMGGYETKPNPVPASQMVYNHVGREILPSFGGQTGIIPTSVTIGEEFMTTYTFTLPLTYDENEIHVISMLIEPSGEINNAGKSTFAVAQLASTSEITLDCGGTVEILTNSGVTTVPNFTTTVANSTTCVGQTIVEQSPLPGTALQMGTNNITILTTDACGNKQVCFKTVNYVDPSFDLQCPQATDLYFSINGSALPDYTGEITTSTTCIPNTITTIQSPVAGSQMTAGVNTVTVSSTNECGESRSCTISVNYVNNAGINEKNSENFVQLFPNPANEVLNFSTSTKNIKSIRILTIDGKEVLKQTTNFKTGKVSLSSLTDGLYTIEFNFENGIKSSQKFIKE